VGDVAQSDTVQLVAAEFGYNVDGGPFFTAGQAALITPPTAP
jgi:hypothetical protein